MAISWIIAVFVFLTDFLIKSYLVANPPSESIPVIKNFLYITLVYNTGAAFGILSGYTYHLIFIGVIFFILFIYFMIKEINKGRLFYISCGCIFGGALSNLWDRITLGYVVDYIDFRIWPVFNLSDTCITVGAFLLFLHTCKSTHIFSFHRHIQKKPDGSKTEKNIN